MKRNHFIHRTLLLLLVTVLALTAVACNKQNTMDTIDFSDVKLENLSYTDKVTDHVLLNVSYVDGEGNDREGNIVIRLYEDVAPITVENFQGLVKDGFYDGLTFHRVYNGFMIQGGDPNGNGSGGSGYPIKGEFAANGVENNLLHVRGVVSMARSKSNDSASSQFFIMHQTTASLDGNYAAFGYVVYGMDTVDGIASTPCRYNSQGELSKPMNTVTINFAKFVKVNGKAVGEITEKPAPPSVMDTLDFSEVKLENLSYSSEATNHVLLNVSYTNERGEKKTGNIVLRLYDEVAPITVENFQGLVGDGFYDGLTFHRVYRGFMIQGGDPEGDGTGGSENDIKGEFSANGINNGLRHVRGVISMARNSYSMDSASSQFFIMHQTTPSLDGSYAAFGYVVYGMDTVDGIASTECVKNSSGELSQPVNTVTINFAKFVTVSDQAVGEITE